MGFPADNQYVALTRGGVPLGDPVKDESPNRVDIVGNSQFPAAYYAYDGLAVYFRLRLAGNPVFKTGFDNFIWGVAFDTDGDGSTIDWFLAVNGKSQTLDLIRNTVKQAGNLRDAGEGVDGKGKPNASIPICNFDIVRAVAAGDNSALGGEKVDTFLDFTISASVLLGALGVTASSPLRLLYYTSANVNNINKDVIGTGTSPADLFCDPFSLEGGSVQASLSIVQKADTGGDVIGGQNTKITGVLSVTNTGKSPATTVFITTRFTPDLVTDFAILGLSLGKAVYDSDREILSWNIGNLAAGQSVELAYSLAAVYVEGGTRQLNAAEATGVDSFTGNRLTPAASVLNVEVISRLGGLSGLLQDKSTGLPLGGVEVVTTGLNGGYSAVTATDKGGVYGFANLPKDVYVTTYSLPAYVTEKRQTEVIPGLVRTEDVLLTPLPSTLQGYVTSAAGGAPIEGALVVLTNSVGVVAGSAVTDAAGFYIVSGLISGSFRVGVSQSSYQSANLQAVLGSGETLAFNIPLRINPGTLTGIVTDESGVPIAGASLDVLDNRNNTVTILTSNANGVYSFVGLAPDPNYRLRASQTNYVTKVVGFSIRAGGLTKADVTLASQPGQLSGTIFDSSNGLPLGSVSIRVFNSEGLTIQTAVSGLDGAYTIESLAPGTYTVLYSEEGYASQTIGARILANQTTLNTITLTRLAGVITGQVTDENGVPLVDAVIRLILGNVFVARIATNNEGVYTIANLSPGSYNAAAVAVDYGRVVQGTVVIAQQTTVLDFKLKRLVGTISGRIISTAGEPISGALITIQQDSPIGTAILVRIITDTEGRYSATNLNPANYIVTIGASDFQSAFAAALVKAEQVSELSFTLSPLPGQVIGIVRDENGSPLSGATVEARTAFGGIVMSGQVTDSTGAYVIPNLAPGNYIVFASIAGRQGAAGSTFLRAGATEEVGFVLFPNPGAVQGTVVDDATGAALGNVSINLLDTSGFVVGTFITSGDGTYWIGNLSPGNYTLVAAASGYQSQTFGAIVLSDTTTPVSLRLAARPGRISGVVSPPVGVVAVELYNIRNLLIQNTITLADGTFQFNDLGEGSYLVKASSQLYSSSAEGAVVVRDGVSDVTITLSPLPGEISGGVKDTSGNPVPQASVRVLDENETPFGVGQADASGVYVVGGLAPRSYTLVASAPGFGSATLGVSITPGLVVRDVDFVLAPLPGGISGQITDRLTGEPIPGASIQIRTPDATGIAVVSVSSSPFGNYLIENLSPGAYCVIVSAPGYTTTVVGAPVESGRVTGASTSLPFEFGSLSGVVIDGASSQPIVNNSTQIKLYTNGGVLLETLFSDSKGGFFIDNLLPGAYTINVVVPGFTSGNFTVNIASKVTTSLTAILEQQLSSLSGTVTDSSGAFLSGVLININGQTGLPIGATTSNQFGAFTLPNLPPGTYSLTAVLTGFGTLTQGVVLRAGESAQTSLKLIPQPGRLVGTVTDLSTSTALSGANIRILDSKVALIGTAVSGSDGSYSFEGLTAGVYVIIATLDKYAASLGGFIILPNQTSRYSFALQPLPGSIVGTIREQGSGSPVAGATVEVRQFNNFGPPLSTIETDAAGVYELLDLSPGNYALSITQPGYVAEQSSALVGAGQTVTLDVALVKVNTVIEGQVVTTLPNPLPVPGAVIIVSDANKVLIQSVITNPAGEYRVESSSAGETFVTAITPVQQIATEPVTVRPGLPSRLNLSLPPGPKTFTGQMTDEVTGSPVPGVTVHVLDVNDVLVATHLTNASGVFLLRGFSSGTYTVIVSNPFYASSSARISVADGDAQTAIPIALNPGFGTLIGVITDARGIPIRKALVEVFQPIAAPADQAGVSPASPSRVRQRSRKSTAREAAALSTTTVNGAARSESPLLRAVISDQAGNYAVTNLPAGILPAYFSFPNKIPVLGRPQIVVDGVTRLDIVLLDEDEE